MTLKHIKEMFDFTHPKGNTTEKRHRLMTIHEEATELLQTSVTPTTTANMHILIKKVWA